MRLTPAGLFLKLKKLSIFSRDSYFYPIMHYADAQQMFSKVEAFIDRVLLKIPLKNFK